MKRTDYGNWWSGSPEEKWARTIGFFSGTDDDDEDSHLITVWVGKEYVGEYPDPESALEEAAEALEASAGIDYDRAFDAAVESMSEALNDGSVWK